MEIRRDGREVFTETATIDQTSVEQFPNVHEILREAASFFASLDPHHAVVAGVPPELLGIVARHDASDIACQIDHPLLHDIAAFVTAIERRARPARLEVLVQVTVVGSEHERPHPGDANV